MSKVNATGLLIARPRNRARRLRGSSSCSMSGMSGMSGLVASAMRGERKSVLFSFVLSSINRNSVFVGSLGEHGLFGSLNRGHRRRGSISSGFRASSSSSSSSSSSKDDVSDGLSGNREKKKKKMRTGWAETAAEALGEDFEALLANECDRLKGLSRAQREAVLGANPGVMRVLAGPGSGKTHVVVNRVRWLIEHENVSPESILCITFTNKAAKELRNRLGKSVGENVVKGITAGTFHALAARILRKHVERLGIARTSDFTIYDSDDSKAVVKDILVEKLKMAKKEANPLSLKSLLSLAKCSLKTSVNVNSRTALESGLIMRRRGTPISYDELNSNYREFDIVWPEYEKKLREANAFDFDDLLSVVVHLLESRPDAKRSLQNRWSHILVDEFQDTSISQYEIVRHLGERAETLFVVGDADQAIYGWRGAEMKNIRSRFEDDFRNVQTVRLGTNYRSTSTIVSAAKTVIAQSVTPSDLMSWDAVSAGAQDVAIVGCDGDREEGAFIVTQVKRLIEDSKSMLDGSLRYRDIAVLYRTKRQSRVLQAAFVKEGVPYVVIGDQSFYNRKEIKDLIAYLRFASNSNDGVSLRRIINTPTRGIGDKTVEKLEEWVSRCEAPSLGAALLERAWAKDGQVDLILENEDKDFRILPSAKEMGITARARNSVLAFAQKLKEIQEMAEILQNPGHILEKVIELTDYENYVKEKEDYEERWEHVRELVQVASNVEENMIEIDIEGNNVNTGSKTTLSAFLEGVSLLSSSEATHGDEMFDDEEEDEARKERANAVNLMTLHASKGTEFDTVFIAGCEEGLTPSRNAESIEEKDEEVRLFYVGVTRAKKKLFLCYAKSRMMFWEKNDEYDESKGAFQERSRFLVAIEKALGENGNAQSLLMPPLCMPKKKTSPGRKNTSTYDWKKRIAVDYAPPKGSDPGDVEKTGRLSRARKAIAISTGIDTDPIEL